MTTEIKQNPALMITLSILGILTVALIAGLLLMQKQEGKDFDLGTALSFRRELPAADDFDPISWAREGAAYPPLQEAEDTAAEELITDYDGAGAIPEAAPKAPPKAPPEAAPKVTPEVVSTVVRKMVTKVVPKVAPKVAPQPVSIQPSAKKSPSRVLVHADKFREVTEKAYWVQLFSSSDPSRAEEVRESFAEQGMPAALQVQEVDGTLWYRVRLGAFTRRSEAEYYAAAIRKMAGFESIYVVTAPVTRQIPRES